MNQTFYGCANITDSQRTETINPSCSPGPGTYEPIIEDNQRIPKWTLKPKIEYTSCFYHLNKDVPAPGAYEVPQAQKSPKNKKNPDFKICKDSKKSYLEKSSPMTEINLPSSIEGGKQFSFGYRDELIVKQKSPGPIYNTDTLNNSSRLKKIKNSCRGFGLGERNKIGKDALSFPGPGQYQSEASHNAKSVTGANWSFGKSQKKHKTKWINSLGPGEYNPKITTANRSCKIKGKFSADKPNQYDAAPGSYDIPDTKEKKGIVFKSQPKDKMIRYQNNTPSPFCYTPMESTLKSGGFSLGKKIDLMNNELQQPGPGSYQLRESLEKKKGGYMGRKVEQKKKLAQSDDNFYKYNPNMDAVTYQSPKYTFSQTQTRSFGVDRSNLGPGDYKLYSNGSDGESYTIPKKQRFKPFSKQKGNKSLGMEDPYSTIGFLPSYIKKKATHNSSVRKSLASKQNTHHAGQNDY